MSEATITGEAIDQASQLNRHLEPLRVDGLSVAYRQVGGTDNPVVWDVTFGLRAREIVGITGESGCGKSTLALACIGYRSRGAKIIGGSATYNGIDLLSMPQRSLQRVWGRHIAHVPQDSAASLNPSLRVGKQLAEPLVKHLGLHGESLRARQLELLDMVGLPAEDSSLRRYPHQYSGGQQQRILLAIALSCRPSVLVLDEPTTGLDVTTQSHIARLIRHLVSETGVAALFISHNLALLSEVVDELIVMYAGEIVESGPVGAVVSGPRHPYTRALLHSLPSIRERFRLEGILGRPPARISLDACAFLPRCAYATTECSSRIPLVETEDSRAVRCIHAKKVESSRTEALLPSASRVTVSDEPLLEVEDLWLQYGRGDTVALKGVSLSVRKGESLGIVGESGSGKSTLLRVIVGLTPPQSGTVRFEGTRVSAKATDRPRGTRRGIQLIFQNPDSSLNPRHSVAQLICRPIQMFQPELRRSERLETAAGLLSAVQLPSSALYAYPTQLSGGQRQRVAIARALAAKPRLLLCDEVTSALDVSVQATIINLVSNLASELGIAVVLVSHDFGVVRSIADRVIVMRAGEVCEEGATEQVLNAPVHDYTRNLIESIPDVRH